MNTQANKDNLMAVACADHMKYDFLFEHTIELIKAGHLDTVPQVLKYLHTGQLPEKS